MNTCATPCSPITTSSVTVPACTAIVGILLMGQPLQLIADASSASECGPVIEVRFVESAPRDRFEFTNRSDDGWVITDITLDLSGSSGKLIFDTIEGGDGVEVFQPFKTDDSTILSRATLPEDGGDRIDMEFDSFLPDTRFSFTIDVDDQLTDSELGQIRVSGSEIEGGTVTGVFRSLQGQEQSVVGRFDKNGRIEAPCMIKKR